MNYDMLEKVICDTIKEEQIKLGYEKETIRLYYPMRSLANILEEELEDPVRMDEALKSFARMVENKLGGLEISRNADRYCILIPPAGAVYVHEVYEDNPFLTALIDTVRRHECTLEQILKVFHSFSDQVECEKSASDEFDYVIYFKNNAADNYRYCIKFDYGHASYHRFIPKDFMNLMEEISESEPVVSEEADGESPEEEETLDMTKEQKYQQLVKLKKAIRCMTTCNEKLDMYKKVAKQFKALGEYKEAGQLAEECRLLAKETKKKIRRKIYKNALKKKNGARKSEDYMAAAEEFRKVSGYKDADDMAMECDTMSKRLEKRMIRKRLLSMGLAAVSVVAALILAFILLF